MRILLVTGAGASRRLGRDGAKMPLMPDWADELCTALDEAENGLAAACGLTTGMSGPEFERSLGLLIRWREMRALRERFEGLGGSNPGERTGPVSQARERMENRLNTVMTVLNRTLYQQFGHRSVDDNAAAVAYGDLLNRLGAEHLAVATTNYDRSLEAALELRGHTANTGFVGGSQQTPIFEPLGMVERPQGMIPVIHLHGAVGWYSKEGIVYDHRADQEYNHTLGTPVVLYPDPDKDPTAASAVRDLWHEFDLALDWSHAVVVLGHSLHDPPLCRRLQQVVREKPVAISYFADDDKTRIEELVRGAVSVRVDFGAESDWDDRALNGFVETLNADGSVTNLERRRRSAR